MNSGCENCRWYNCFFIEIAECKHKSNIEIYHNFNKDTEEFKSYPYNINKDRDCRNFEQKTTIKTLLKKLTTKE